MYGMARAARIVAAGLPHHITQRGNRRQPTLFREGANHVCRGLMAEWCVRYEVEDEQAKRGLPSLDERIAHREIRKPPEMAISGPQLAHTMQVTKGGNVRIMHLRTDDLSFLDGVTQLGPVPAHLGEECEARRLQPRIDLIESDSKGGCRSVDRRVGHDGQKLMKAGPWNCPRRSTLRQLGDPRVGDGMPRGVFPMGID